MSIIELIKEATGTTSTGLAIAMLVVGLLIIIFALVGIVINIFFI